MTQGDQTLRCELRAASAGASWDLQLFDGEGLISSSRRPTEDNARDAAEYLRRMHLRGGWTQTDV
jgi:hypothetical protein